MLTPQEPRGFDSREQALEQTRSRLFVEAGGEGERRLAQALDEMLEECDDGRFRIRGAPVFRPALVSWRPAGVGAGGRPRRWWKGGGNRRQTP